MMDRQKPTDQKFPELSHDGPLGYMRHLFSDQYFDHISSVRSSSGYHGLIEIQRSKATFSNFSDSSDSKMKVKVKGPNMCYIFEKHGIQGYRI